MGDGGVSSFEGGAPFKDEFHSRLKFNHRGLIAMANANEADANGSQFFLTFDSCGMSSSILNILSSALRLVIPCFCYLQNG